MISEKTPTITVEALLYFREEADALRVITDKLRVKEMGPADHIRTKHEVKAFVASGSLAAAEALLKAATTRHAAQRERERMAQRAERQMG